MKKRIMVFALAAVLAAVVLAGCGGRQTPSSVSSAAPTAPPSSRSSLPAFTVPSTVMPVEGTTYEHEMYGTKFAITLPDGLYVQGDGIHQDSRVVPENILQYENTNIEITKPCWFMAGEVLSKEGDSYILSLETRGTVSYEPADTGEPDTYMQWGDYVVLVSAGDVIYYQPGKGVAFDFMMTNNEDLYAVRAYFDPIIASVIYL